MMPGSGRFGPTMTPLPEGFAGFVWTGSGGRNRRQNQAPAPAPAPAICWKNQIIILTLVFDPKTLRLRT